MSFNNNIRRFFLFLRQVFLFPHILAYRFSKQKELISEDINIFKEKWNIDYGYATSLVLYLVTNKYYRNVFYMRISRIFQLICPILLPRAKDFYPCHNMGGGVILSHPYSTIINAKSVGSHLSIRQCTTIGNKRDGEGRNGPIIGDNVTLGANVCVIGSIIIGNNVTVGAGAVVVKDVPDNAIVAGNPAKIIKYNQ